MIDVDIAIRIFTLAPTKYCFECWQGMTAFVSGNLFSLVNWVVLIGESMTNSVHAKNLAMAEYSG